MKDTNPKLLVGEEVNDRISYAAIQVKRSDGPVSCEPSADRLVKRIAIANTVPMVAMVPISTGMLNLDADMCDHVRHSKRAVHSLVLERKAGITLISRLCMACAYQWTVRMHALQVICDYCNNPVPKDKALLWMPKTASAERGDEPMTVCPFCASTSPSLREDINADETQFLRSVHSIPKESL